MLLSIRQEEARRTRKLRLLCSRRLCRSKSSKSESVSVCVDSCGDPNRLVLGLPSTPANTEDDMEKTRMLTLSKALKMYF